jgi:hypothetical protein
MAGDAEYVDVADARHMVAGDRNDVFASAILSFLAKRFGPDPPVPVRGSTR